MCNRTMLGKKIKDNVIFIAACNPYRRIAKKIEKIGLIKDKSKVQNLVYTVNPLPHSLLNYVFDFGNLTEKDENAYIRSILSQIPSNILDDKNREIAINIVFFAQKFIRDNNDISSVSLRELNRVNILYQWFYQFIKSKRKEIPIFKDLKDEDIQLNSIILSIYVCYYIRIYNKQLRKNFNFELNKSINVNIESFPLKFQKEISDRIQLEPGIAKNSALLENIFTLFVCINNKIPVFICGKPGCSKSLSVQLLYKSMKGDNSSDLMFKSLPRIIMNTFHVALSFISQ